MKPRLAPLIVLLAGVAHGANVETVPASVAAPSIARSATQTPPFDPETMLASKNLSPSAISFEVGGEPASIVEGGPQEPARLRLRTIHDGELVAMFGFVGVPAQAGRWMVSTSHVTESRRGSGLGTLSYLIGARLIDELDGSLSSRPDDRKQDASVVWMRLIAAGLARHHEEPDGSVVDVVDRPAVRAASEKAHAFFLQRLRNPQALRRP